MTDILLIIFGGLAACMLALSAFSAIGEKDPWGFFAGTATASLLAVGGLGWLTYTLLTWLLAWVAQNGVIAVILAVIAGFCLFVLFMVGFASAVAGLFNPGIYRD